MKGWKYAAIGFLVGAVTCGALVLVATHGAGAKLNAELKSAANSAQSLRTSLADAVTANHGLADQLQKLQGQLDKSSRLLAIDDAVIARQQLTITAGQRILAGISTSIASSGGDIEKTISAIADGFGRLFRLYHANPIGSKKGPG